MKVLITGGFGFLGWHTACRLRAKAGIDPLLVGRDEFSDASRLARAVAGADVILHLAGVNRAESEADVKRGNIDLATTLAGAIRASGRPVRVVYANSIQAELGNEYGEGKAQAARLLSEATASVGGTLVDVLFPNLFGEHGRPHYNSFVATFCRVVADGESPVVTGDKEVPLLHAQAAAQVLMDAMSGPSEQLRPEGEPRMVSEVLAMVQDFHELYSSGEVPALTDPFRVALFNTYRSYAFPQRFPLHPETHADSRGCLVETCRVHGGTGQSFVSITRPGSTRGDHYHLHKVERFFVVSGAAEISLRRLLHDEVITFRLDGARPGFVDMPTLWVHNIRNIGDEDLITVFWADQLLDREKPDQYPEPVEMGKSA